MARTALKLGSGTHMSFGGSSITVIQEPGIFIPYDPNGGQATYVLDMQDMTIRVIFDYYPTDVQITMFLAYGLLNRGGGVGYKWYRIKTDETFGFDDQELLPFNQGIFSPYRLTEGF